MITKGKGAMPPFASVAAAATRRSDCVSDEAGSGCRRAVRRLPRRLGGGRRGEPPYPEGVDAAAVALQDRLWQRALRHHSTVEQITAYDLNTGKIKWQTPYGDLPEAGPSDKLRGNVYPKSGFVITAGGLVLFAGNDSKLYALDKDTGNRSSRRTCRMVLWAYRRSTR